MGHFHEKHTRLNGEKVYVATTVGSDCVLGASVALRLQADFQVYVRLGERIATLVSHIETLTLDSDARFLDSIPRISPLLAARYQAAIIAVSRFPSAAHIWAFAGYDLVTDESGDTKRLGKITKRGDPTFRDALFHIGYHTARPSVVLTSMLASADSTRLSLSSMPPTKPTVSASPSCVTNVPTGLSLPRSKHDSIVAGRPSTRRADDARDRNRSPPRLAWLDK